jgi:hypothetical protein
VLDDPQERRDRMENALKMNSLKEHQLTVKMFSEFAAKKVGSFESENENCLGLGKILNGNQLMMLVGAKILIH